MGSSLLPQEVKDLSSGDEKIVTAYSELSSASTHIYPTKCAPINVLLGGGLYSGKILELYGKEASGKSTLGLEFAFAFCHYWDSHPGIKYTVLWIETEYVLDKVRVQMMAPGLIKRFMISECECIEDAEAVILRVLAKAKEMNVRVFIVWDTIAAAPTKKEKEGLPSMGGMHKAMVIRSMLRKVTPLLAVTDSTLIIVNQVSANDMGNQEPTGGGGIRFHASTRLRLTIQNTIMELRPDGTEIQLGIRSELFSKKNKLTNPSQSTPISIIGEKGLDPLDTSISFLKAKQMIDLKGGWSRIWVPAGIGNGVLVGTKDVPEEGKVWTQLCFQNVKQLREKTVTTLPHAPDWFDYKTYDYYCKFSPLMKIRLIKQLWGYEEKFFGKQLTKLDSREIEAAAMIYKDLQQDAETEDPSNSVDLSSEFMPSEITDERKIERRKQAKKQMEKDERAIEGKKGKTKRDR